MLVILASRRDPEARELVARWAAHRAVLLTCEELSMPGWSHRPHRGASGAAVLGGRRVPVSEIRGVLVRWPSVFDRELLQIVEADRAYVAAEMTAFLRSWLVSLPCPVVNRPSASSLTGPAWRPEQWVHRAARLGLPVRPVHRRVRRPGAEDGEPGAEDGEPGAEDGEPDSVLSHRVSVVGDRWFGHVEPVLGERALRLARAEGVELLTVHFSRRDARGELITADLMPPLEGKVADAVAELLLGGTAAGAQGAAA